MKGIRVGGGLMLMHLLFVGSVFLFTNQSMAEGHALEDILNLYKKVKRMLINVEKSVLCFNGVEDRIR
jgi:hypothetical protein